LGLDRRFIDHGEYLGDPPAPENVKGVFVEDDPASVDWQAKKFSDRRTVEPKAGRDMIFIGEDEGGVEMEIWNVATVLFEHGPIAVQTKTTPVVNRAVGHERAQSFPIPGIQARDICAVENGQINVHGAPCAVRL
jgi:hypothetical protein